jgi:hypothetical protein
MDFDSFQELKIQNLGYSETPYPKQTELNL